MGLVLWGVMCCGFLGARIHHSLNTCVISVCCVLGRNCPRRNDASQQSRQNSLPWVSHIGGCWYRSTGSSFLPGLPAGDLAPTPMPQAVPGWLGGGVLLKPLGRKVPGRQKQLVTGALCVTPILGWTQIRTDWPHLLEEAAALQ
jgi:hypothetical protein